MLKSNFCNTSYAYILEKVTRGKTVGDAAVLQAEKQNKSVIFKSYEPFPWLDKQNKYYPSR